MTSGQGLSVYLNDHLAGSAAALDLAARIREESEGTALGTFLAQLIVDVEADQDQLQRVMDRLEIEQSSLKQAGSRVMEKVSQLKFKEPGAGPAVTRLLQIEFLQLGVQGKHALWRALAHLTAVEPRLSRTDFDALMKRADDQVAGLEQHRLEAAELAASG